MTKAERFKTATVVAVVAFVCIASKASAAQCGNTAAGFEAWKNQFVGEARARASARPRSQPSRRLPIRLQPSRLTVGKRASACHSISFSPSAAARPSSRVGARSNNLMQHFSRLSSNGSASRPGRSWPFGEWRRASAGRAGIRTSSRRWQLSPMIAVGLPISPTSYTQH